MIIWVRCRYGGFKIGKNAIPFKIETIWDKQTTIKMILEALYQGGYGSRKFEYK